VITFKFITIITPRPVRDEVSLFLLLVLVLVSVSLSLLPLVLVQNEVSLLSLLPRPERDDAVVYFRFYRFDDEVVRVLCIVLLLGLAFVVV